MIRPSSLYDKFRFTRNFASMGRVAAVLCGNRHISREDLTDDELSHLEEVENENDEMDKNMAKEAKRKAVYRASKMSQDVQQCPTDKLGRGGRDGASTPNNQTTNLPTYQTTKHNNTRSVTVTVPKLENGNGTGLSENVEKFRSALKSGGEGAFFSADFDPVAIAVYITGDADSSRRWRQAMKGIGEGRFRDELFAFYREIANGEEPDNRGAALNARLLKIEKEVAK